MWSVNWTSVQCDMPDSAYSMLTTMGFFFSSVYVELINLVQEIHFVNMFEYVPKQS